MARVVFLLGAGASPADIPCTEQITKRVLSGKGTECHCYRGVYQYTVAGQEVFVQRQGELQPWRGHIRPIIGYLRQLHGTACHYYQNWQWPQHYGHCPNYEDIYYQAAQIAYEGSLPNPLIGGKAEAIRRKAERLADAHRDLQPRDKLTRLALLYIEGVVKSLLSRRPASTDHLGGLVGRACQDLGPQNVDIATLNHDRVIDAFLRASNIPYDDGFERKAADGFRRFLPSVYQRSYRDGRARVMKLHGGVDWIQRYSRIADDAEEYQIGIMREGSPAQQWSKKDYGTYGLPIQIGTHNKIANYTLYRYLTDLQFRFVHSLDRADLVVIAGYSFGDAGINARVHDWVSKSRKRRLVIVDPCPDNAKRNADGVWYEWQTGGNLGMVEKRIEDTTWDEVVRSRA